MIRIVHITHAAIFQVIIKHCNEKNGKTVMVRNSTNISTTTKKNKTKTKQKQNKNPK